MHLEILASAVPRLHQEAYGKMTPKRPGYHVIYDEETNKGCVWCDRHTLYTHTHSLSHKYTKYARTHTHTHTHTQIGSPRVSQAPVQSARKAPRQQLQKYGVHHWCDNYSLHAVLSLPAQHPHTHTTHTHTPPITQCGITG
jgi:hypothetical protein